MKTISLIITLQNEENKIKQIFDVIDGVKFGRGIKLTEVIFVDNGSVDGTLFRLSIVAQSHSKFITSIISYKKPKSLKRAQNEAKKHVKTDYKMIFMSNFPDLETKIRRLEKRIKNKKKPKLPTLSIAIPVMNGQKYLTSTLNSVLKQTFKNFEVIIVDNATTDKSAKVINRFIRRSKKIKAITNVKPIGFAKSTALALAQAKGDYIAIIEPGEISLPHRFEKQIEYLKANPKIVAVGGHSISIDSKGKIINENILPASFEEIYSQIFKFYYAQASTLLMAVKRLPRDFAVTPQAPEELIFNLFKYGKIENISEHIVIEKTEKSSLRSKLNKQNALAMAMALKGAGMHGYKPNIEAILDFVFKTISSFIQPQKRGPSTKASSRKVYKRYAHLAI